MSRHFISAGWPYLYDIPGLHNCFPMLFADICARYFRLKGEEVYYLCGADEHGARTEYVAQGYGTTPKELLDSKYDATLPLLKKLELSLDAFERTSDKNHQKFVQNFIEDLIKRELIIESSQKVAWCTHCQQHLPDRFLEGICPHCDSKTYGNQCNNKKDCARLIEADEIKNGRCAVCAGPVEWRMEVHLFFKMEGFQKVLTNCAKAPEKDKTEVSNRIERSFAENPLVCVTRDTSWGIPIAALPNKSVYSWVDSLLAKVSMIAKHGTELEKKFWKSDDTQRHFFLGMDGTPFYGALFPSLLLASSQKYSVANWHIMPNEVFIYEGGICSKSTGTGIWLQEALDTLPAEFWRFYVFYIHATVETGSERDIDFRWDRFCELINTWLLQKLSGVAECKIQSSGSNGKYEAQQISEYIESGKYGQAFQLLLNSIIEDPSNEKTQQLAPLLSCFLPKTAEKLLNGVRPYDMPPLYYPEVQMEYQDKVDSRRAERKLMEEITDARADALCVCPINLKEQ